MLSIRFIQLALTLPLCHVGAHTERTCDAPGIYVSQSHGAVTSSLIPNIESLKLTVIIVSAEPVQHYQYVNFTSDINTAWTCIAKL